MHIVLFSFYTKVNSNHTVLRCRRITRSLELMYILYVSPTQNKSSLVLSCTFTYTEIALQIFPGVNALSAILAVFHILVYTFEVTSAEFDLTLSYEGTGIS